jgi:hypothetical protein
MGNFPCSCVIYGVSEFHGILLGKYERERIRQVSVVIVRDHTFREKRR